MVNVKSLKNLNPAKRGEKSRNPSGVSSKISRGSRIFKESLFEFHQKNKKLFEKAMREHPMDTLKVLASICPREDDDRIKDLITALSVTVNKNYGNNG
jgi:hypothetical protein